MQPAEFLRELWGADEIGALCGVHIIAEKTPGGIKHHPVYSVADAAQKAESISAAGRDAYFALAEFKAADNRKASNALGAQCFWTEIDCGIDKDAGKTGYRTKEDARNAIIVFCAATGIPVPSIAVDSGNGLHCYWFFNRLLSAEAWQKYARQFKRLMAEHGLRADPSRTADIASILRVPGTNNYKEAENPKQVTS